MGSTPTDHPKESLDRIHSSRYIEGVRERTKDLITVSIPSVLFIIGGIHLVPLFIMVHIWLPVVVFGLCLAVIVFAYIDILKGD